MSNILIVDDEKIILETLKDVLDEFFPEMNIYVAENFETALDIIKKTGIEVIISDIQMPGMKGSDLVALVHKILPNTEIIMITGAIESLDSYDEYIFNKIKPDQLSLLEKPISNEVLVRMVRRSLTIVELKQLNEIIFAALEKSSSLGEMFLSNTHDLKNILLGSTLTLESVVIPNLQENLKETPEKHELIGAISDVHASLQQGKEFFEALLSANKNDIQIKDISINDLISKSVTIVYSMLKKNNIKWNLDVKYFGSIKGTNNIINVFVNLIKNAIESVSDKQEKIITLKIESIDDKVLVSIKDNGNGIQEDVLSKLRKGIKTTTKGDAGNGYGISSAVRLLKDLNGSLDIQSEINKGSVFTIELQKGIEAKKKNDSIEFF